MPPPIPSATKSTWPRELTTVFRLKTNSYAYDPVADQWSARAARPTYRSNFASAVVNGLLYVIGGSGRTDNGPGVCFDCEHKSHVEIYDPTTDRWSTGAPLPTALSNGKACVFSDQIYIFGGASISSPHERFIFTYNTTSNSWSAKSPMPTTRYYFACAAVDDKVYLLGGSTPDAVTVDTIERYDPFVETWSSPTRLKTPRLALSAPVVGKRIITMGGMTWTPYSPSNPVTYKAVDVVEILDTEGL